MYAQSLHYKHYKHSLQYLGENNKSKKGVLLLFSLLGYCYVLKGHCHGIWQLYKKLDRRCLFINWIPKLMIDLVLLFKTVWRYWYCFLSPVACRYGWHGWRWIEILKNWQFFFKFLCHVLEKSSRNLLWLAFSDKIHLISSF